MAVKCELTMEEQMERLSMVEEGYGIMPDDASTIDLLQMIAAVTGETFVEVNTRFKKIKEKKKRRKK